MTCSTKTPTATEPAADIKMPFTVIKKLETGILLNENV